jgi:CSLREA domain-containing protein
MKMDTHAPTLRARLSPALRFASAAIAAVAMLTPAVQTQAASEATITVNTAADENGTNPAACSFREAVTAASTDAAFGGCTAGALIDTIVFNVPANSVITLGSGTEPGIPAAANGQKLTIDGSTAVNLTINRTTPGRLLKVETLTADVTLNGFTMSGGNVPSTTLVPSNIAATGDGSGGAVLSLGPAVVLNNMTFRNNYAANYGGAVYAGSVITATGTRFENNSSGYFGGAVMAGVNKFGTSRINTSTFVTNTARFEGGALFIKGSTNLNEQRRLFVNESTFTNNSVTAPLGGQAARGGAILANSPVDISKSRFENNTSTVFCGGVYLYNAESITQLSNVPMVVTDTVFINNDGYLGGALCADGPLTGNGSTFERNDTSIDGGAIRGRNDVTVGTSTFLSNTAASTGGAIAAAPNSFPPSSIPLKLSVSRSLFRNNSAPSGSGGAVYGISLTVASNVVNSLFNENTSSSGSAIAITGTFSSLAVQHSTFVGNTSNSDKGTIDTLGGAITTTNSIIANNTGNGVNRQFTGTHSENYNLFFNNTGTGGDRGAGIATGANSATGNPNFVSATDFHLSATSALAIDKASTTGNTNAIDFDGDVRPIGAARDIGYDEYNPNSGIAGLALTSSSPTRVGDVTLFTTTVTSGSGIVYEFNFGDGSPVAAGSAVSTTGHTYAAEGSYTAIVTATNSFGTRSATTVVNVTNTAPTANAGTDVSAAPGASVTLNGSGSADADGHTPLSYQWTQTSGAPVTLSDATIASPSFTAPAAAGDLIFSLIVTDAKGKASAADTVKISVNAAAIAGLAGVASSPTELGKTTTFTATVTGGATPITYEWNFGDGSPVVTGAVVTHTYAAAGGYTVILTGTNSAGSVIAAPITVVVAQPNRVFMPLAQKGQ